MNNFLNTLVSTFCLLFFPGVMFAQAMLGLDYPMIDNTLSFLTGNYDTALLQKNKVESCRQENQIFYFDSSGHVIKNVQYRSYDSTTQVQLFRYDAGGDLVETEVLNPRYHLPIITRFFKTYEDGRLTIDSSSSGYFCKHIGYYQNGSLRHELWFGPNHRLHRGFWFGADSAGRINRIIDRDYMSTTDTSGQLISNRTLFYNERSQLIREEEAIKWQMKKERTPFCPNAGSASFIYDDAYRLTEIIRRNGPSQKIKYLSNGLIAEIETKGNNCEGTPYHWKWTYTYTYRNRQK